MHQTLSTSLDPFSRLPWEARLAIEILQHPISLQLHKAATDVLDDIAQRRQPTISDAEAHLLRTCSAAVVIAEQAEASEFDPHFADAFEKLLEAAQ